MLLTKVNSGLELAWFDVHTGFSGITMIGNQTRQGVNQAIQRGAMSAVIHMGLTLIQLVGVLTQKIAFAHAPPTAAPENYSAYSGSRSFDSRKNEAA